MNLLSNEEKKELLKIARKTIEEKVYGSSEIEAKENFDIFNEKYGAFVTLHINGNLRGCIGNIIGYNPLKETIKNMSIASAFEDPRFKALEKRDYSKIDIEISVLSIPKEVSGIDDIIVGEHGLIVSKGFNKGLLLPQVATENRWDKETFLSHCCMKAFLPPDEWKSGVKIEVFSADVFGEKNDFPELLN